MRTAKKLFSSYPFCKKKKSINIKKKNRTLRRNKNKKNLSKRIFTMRGG